MLRSLQDAVQEPAGTKAAIRQALMSPAGLRVAWVVVESEEDVAVYQKFMRLDSTVVKTSESATGRKGYDYVEAIVREIKEEERRAHIIGIRDADYSRFDKDYLLPANIFVTDRRDLEMMLLESESVKLSMRDWTPAYEDAFNRCVPICRHFGYLRIYNEVAHLFVRFHDNLRPNKYWDFQCHSVDEGWELDSTEKFVKLSQGACTVRDVNTFIANYKLEAESLYDICRGHDFLKLLSLTLVDDQTFSEGAIMNRMTEAYALDDFKKTRLYSDIFAWQTEEGVVALVA